MKRNMHLFVHGRYISEKYREKERKEERKIDNFAYVSYRHDSTCYLDGSAFACIHLHARAVAYMLENGEYRNRLCK